VYASETIREKIGLDLANIVTPAYSFDVGQIDTTSLEDASLMESPSLQLTAVDGSSDLESFNWRIGSERYAFRLDLFAKDGDLVSTERAAADVRNVLETADSALRAAGIAAQVVVAEWSFIEGDEAARSAEHRVTFHLEVTRTYNRGDA